MAINITSSLKIFGWVVFLVASMAAGCRDLSVEITEPRPEEDVLEATAFDHVNLITMENGDVLSDQTVLISNFKIEAIGKSGTVTIPDNYYRIEAKGAYLMPGLADMHTHIWYAEDILPYVFNGVTTVLNMGSPASILQFRSQANNHEIISPTIFASGFVDGPDSRGWYARTPAEAEEAVSEIKGGGWDFIKVYNSIPADAYQALMSKAKAEGIAVIGHGVRAPGMQGILSSGQVMIAHSEEFLYTFFKNSLTEAKIAEAVAITKTAGAYVTPNLCTYETISRQWGNPIVLQQLLNVPEMKYVSPKWKNNFWKQFDFSSRSGSINAEYNFLKKFTKSLHDGGVPLLIGTDTPFMIGQVNGYAIHDDIRNLVDSGLTPYQALASATKVPGEFIARYVQNARNFGLIKEGYKADLLLLSANPLEDVSALKKRIGVMINGRWLSEKKLQGEMDKLAAGL